MIFAFRHNVCSFDGLYCFLFWTVAHPFLVILGQFTLNSSVSNPGATMLIQIW